MPPAIAQNTASPPTRIQSRAESGGVSVKDRRAASVTATTINATSGTAHARRNHPRAKIALGSNR